MEAFHLVTVQRSDRVLNIVPSLRVSEDQVMALVWIGNLFTETKSQTIKVLCVK